MRPIHALNEAQDGFRGRSLLKGWSAVLLCAPVWWLLGLNLIVFHVTAYLLIMGLVLEGPRIRQRWLWTPISVLPLWIGVIGGVSLLIHLRTGDPERIMAAVYNLSFWFMGAMLIIVLSASFTASYMTRFLRHFMLLAVMNVVFILTALGAAALGKLSWDVATPLHGLTRLVGGGDAVLVDYSVSVRLLTPDWFASTAVPRLNILGPYPTAGAGFMMIVLVMLFTWGCMNNNTRNPAFLLLFAVNLLGFFMTLSRMPIVAFFTCCALVWLVQKNVVWTSIVVLCLLGVAMLPAAQQSLEYVLLAREGSTNSRFDLYLHSVAQLQGIDWGVGLGLKPRVAAFDDMPIGSHSTYVSLLFRTGICGLAGFVMFQVLLIARWYGLMTLARMRREDFLVWRAFGLVFLMMGFWMLTEDIDAPQLLAFTYFSCIGIFEGFRRVVLARASVRSAIGEPTACLAGLGCAGRRTQLVT